MAPSVQIRCGSRDFKSDFPTSGWTLHPCHDPRVHHMTDLSRFSLSILAVVFRLLEEGLCNGTNSRSTTDVSTPFRADCLPKKDDLLCCSVYNVLRCCFPVNSEEQVYSIDTQPLLTLHSLFIAPKQIQDQLDNHRDYQNLEVNIPKTVQIIKSWLGHYQVRGNCF
jgi:hypothetical protein